MSNLTRRSWAAIYPHSAVASSTCSTSITSKISTSSFVVTQTTAKNPNHLISGLWQQLLAYSLPVVEKHKQ